MSKKNKKGSRIEAAPQDEHSTPSGQIFVTDQVVAMLHALPMKARTRAVAVIEMLATYGVSLGSTLTRPIVSSDKLQELRFRAGGTARTHELRVLYAYDTRQQGQLIVGGDKTGEWAAWYDRTIPLAEAWLAAHEASMSREQEATAHHLPDAKRVRKQTAKTRAQGKGQGLQGKRPPATAPQPAGTSRPALSRARVLGESRAWPLARAAMDQPARRLK